MNYYEESKIFLARIRAELSIDHLNKTDRKTFDSRLDQHFPKLFENLFNIYGHKYDLYYHLRKLVQSLADNYSLRSSTLKNTDREREKIPNWYQDERWVGMACYVDLVAEDLIDLKSKIPYYKALGITYLHLMPLYLSPEGENDGGYAVSDYRKVAPDLGTIDHLRDLANAFRNEGILLVLDFVFNHTSDEHKWAMAAKAGEKEFQNYYFMFDDRTIPDQYEQNLREIFPQVRRGSFTHYEDLDKWVWTTFNSFQWDLNYSNPDVFIAISQEMLFLANAGCDVLRLDALAFVWKEMGTTCESQPKAHNVIRAFNDCLKITAPGVVFKSEAIVHPDEVVSYIDSDECQLSYNPLLMALLWNSLATRKTRLLNHSLSHRFNIKHDCSWVNYARCHDDIGWTFDDGDAWQLGINGYDHRRFLNDFYTGKFQGSFATGEAFQENPETGDCRVCGSLASLSGLSNALHQKNPVEIKNAFGRILLLHSVLLSIGGIPLLYQGDELGKLNDYDYLSDDAKKDDARWVNRPKIHQGDIALAQTKGTPQQAIYSGLQQLISIRKNHSVFGQAATQILPTSNHHLFAFSRGDNQKKELLVIMNFSDAEQTILMTELCEESQRNYYDLLGKSFDAKSSFLILKPYEFRWLMLGE